MNYLMWLMNAHSITELPLLHLVHLATYMNSIRKLSPSQNHHSSTALHLVHLMISAEVTDADGNAALFKTQHVFNRE